MTPLARIRAAVEAHRAHAIDAGPPHESVPGCETCVALDAVLLLAEAMHHHRAWCAANPRATIAYACVPALDAALAAAADALDSLADTIRDRAEGKDV